MVWPCLPFIRSGQNPLARHSERGGGETRQTEEEVRRQHQGIDRRGVHQVPEISEEQGKLEQNWLRNDLWCFNDPHGQEIDEMMRDDICKQRMWHARNTTEHIAVTKTYISLCGFIYRQTKGEFGRLPAEHN